MRFILKNPTKYFLAGSVVDVVLHRHTGQLEITISGVVDGEIKNETFNGYDTFADFLEDWKA